jgi:hypothetical protein
MISFAIWMQNTPLFEAVRDSPYAYPIILTLHLSFISLFAAMVLATDVRLLGWGLRKHSISDIVNQLRVPKWIGLALVVTCGILILGSKAEEYFYNIFFQTKVALLALVGVHALVFRGSVYSKAAEMDKMPEPPARAKLAADLSLILWLCIACAGRAIGYVNPPAGSHHFVARLISAPPL